eukprot:CAMPEP_0113991242 /NCGR_PEP_ID=MMETSP0328-20130328/8971_1 /TAXON_ID=39455 /ORGANISM="Alexandrium minutum" /LENGTH=38 /assembly_acc=CAM_ASM_000350
MSMQPRLAAGRISASQNRLQISLRLASATCSNSAAMQR